MLPHTHTHTHNGDAPVVPEAALVFRSGLVISGLCVVALVEFGAELVTFEATLVVSGPAFVV